MKDNIMYDKFITLLLTNKSFTGRDINEYFLSVHKEVHYKRFKRLKGVITISYLPIFFKKQLFPFFCIFMLTL